MEEQQQQHNTIPAEAGGQQGLLPQPPEGSIAPMPPASARPPAMPPLPPPVPASIPAAATPSPPSAVRPHAPTAALWFFALLLMTLLLFNFVRSGVFSLYALLLLTGFTSFPDWFSQMVNSLDSISRPVPLLLLVMIIIWQGCAFGSLRRLYGGQWIQHGRGSGFWWITPVANFFMPFHCLRELRWFSRAQQAGPAAGVSAGVLAWAAQGLLAFNTVFGVTSQALERKEAEAALGTMAGTAANLLANFGGMTFAAVLTTFILRNLIHQVLLCRRWQAAARPPFHSCVLPLPAAPAVAWEPTVEMPRL